MLRSAGRPGGETPPPVGETSVGFQAGDNSMLYPDTMRAVGTDLVKRMLGLRDAFVEANRERLLGAVREAVAAS